MGLHGGTKYGSVHKMVIARFEAYGDSRPKRFGIKHYFGCCFHTIGHFRLHQKTTQNIQYSLLFHMMQLNCVLLTQHADLVFDLAFDVMFDISTWKFSDILPAS